mgnify:CR=1 FL=1
MNNFGYHAILSLFWLIISYYTGYYEVYRYSKGIEIFGKLLKQFFFSYLNKIYIFVRIKSRRGLSVPLN